jgi:hypothetical protein
MDHNQEFKHMANRAIIPEAEPFLLVKVVRNADTIQLSIKDNLKSTNSCSRQPNKSPIWWRIKTVPITKLPTTDILKPNTTSQLLKRKTAVSNPIP